MAGIRYQFGEFELDAQARRLSRSGDLLSISDRHFEVLLHLVSHPGELLSKDALVSAAWGDVAVTDNSLEQAVSALRRTLGTGADGRPFIETVPRRGYRFITDVTRTASRASDDSLDALLAPHRAWLEGLAALETLERDRIRDAREAFERVLRMGPEHPLAHVGLANACAMQFETTRADAAPDVEALAAAAAHARAGCRLEPQSGEAWATLGFVLDRSGQHVDAVAALRRAVTLEPDNWRHHFRLSYASWGEERLRSARRTLALLPGFPLAHWMAATVHVARNLLDEAEHELNAGIDVQHRQGAHGRFSAVGLHWLKGLIHLSRNEADTALAEFERELASESAGHLYTRECCANTWYAIGALRLRQDRVADARLAFQRVLERVSIHPLAHIALAGAGEAAGSVSASAIVAAGASSRLGVVETAIARGVLLALHGDRGGAARIVEQALAAAPAGHAGWLLPVEPLLHVTAHPGVWSPSLERLRARAA